MMSPKTLLVHLDASARCGTRLQAAGRLAGRHGAAVQALYAVVPGALRMPFADVVTAELADRIRPADDERRNRARAAFDEAVAAGLAGATWLDPIEEVSLRGFVRQAFYSDLVVLGQREAGEGDDPGVPADFVETVLVDSGRPVLVVPYIGLQATLGRRIMVAWKESRETARAVAAALPFLAAADRVDVVTWAAERSGQARRQPLLGEQLARHGVQVHQHDYGDEPGDIGAYILSAAADLNADLVVMGGYGHSRAREWVLGGATRTLLASMTVPVLMVH